VIRDKHEAGNIPHALFHEITGHGDGGRVASSQHTGESAGGAGRTAARGGWRTRARAGAGDGART
jgi:hypothetical protein